MKKFINLKEYYARIDRGRGVEYLQDGIYYDTKGYSLEDFEEPEEISNGLQEGEGDKEEVEDAQEGGKSCDIEPIISQRGRPFTSEKMAKRVAMLKKLEKYSIKPYRDGYAIFYNIKF